MLAHEGPVWFALRASRESPLSAESSGDFVSPGWARMPGKRSPDWWRCVVDEKELMDAAVRRLGAAVVAGRGVVFEAGMVVKARSVDRPMSVAEFMGYFGRRLEAGAFWSSGMEAPLSGVAQELVEVAEAIRGDLLPAAVDDAVPGKVRVVGDGTPRGTRVEGPGGGLIRGVMRLDFELDATSEPSGLLGLEIRGPVLDLGFDPADVSVQFHAAYPANGDGGAIILSNDHAKAVHAFLVARLSPGTDDDRAVSAAFDMIADQLNVHDQHQIEEDDPGA